MIVNCGNRDGTHLVRAIITAGFKLAITVAEDTVPVLYKKLALVPVSIDWHH